MYIIHIHTGVMADHFKKKERKKEKEKKRSTSIDFPYRHAIGRRPPDGVVVREIY